MKLKKYLTKKNIIIFIIIIYSVIISTIYIWGKDIYCGVDTAYHLSRIRGIVNSWKSGDLLAFIHLDDTGYGYGMGFFYSNLSMLLPAILNLMGVNIIISYKIFIFICGLATAVSMYMCVKSISGKKYSAVIASFIYTTSGYRIITMVTKAFIGEVLSFIFIPIILLGLYEIIARDEKKMVDFFCSDL